MHIIVNPKYEEQRASVEEAIRNYATSGTYIYEGRNTLKSFDVDGRCVVVKSFRPLGFVKGIIYSFFRKSKARRSYENAITFARRGVDTPCPIAYAEARRFGLLHSTFYMCEYTAHEEIATQLNGQATYNESLAKAFAQFVADLHLKGILHYDLNSGNVLFKKESESKLKSKSEYHFQLIDINRVKFMPEGTVVPMADCLENITLFTGNRALHAYVAECYARYRGLDVEKFTKQAVAVKTRHDKIWRLRKRITHPFRRR